MLVQQKLIFKIIRPAQAGLFPLTNFSLRIIPLSNSYILRRFELNKVNKSIFLDAYAGLRIYLNFLYMIRPGIFDMAANQETNKNDHKLA